MTQNGGTAESQFDNLLKLVWLNTSHGIHSVRALLHGVHQSAAVKIGRQVVSCYAVVYWAKEYVVVGVAIAQ